MDVSYANGLATVRKLFGEKTKLVRLKVRGRPAYAVVQETNGVATALGAGPTIKDAVLAAETGRRKVAVLDSMKAQEATQVLAAAKARRTRWILLGLGAASALAALLLFLLRARP